MFDVEKLEFNLVLEKLKKYIQNEVSLSYFDELNFYTDEASLQEELDRTDEALVILNRVGSIPLSGIFDIRFSAKRASLGATLTIKDLMDIKSNLARVRDNQNFLDNLDRLNIKTKYYENFVKDMFFDKKLFQTLDTNIVDGMLVDNASKTLSEIRKKLSVIDTQIDEVVKGILAKSSYLSERLVTSRNGRTCLMVKAEYKNKFEGIVHDVSGSGETYFIEPKRVVELTNKKQNLYNQELAEIERILSEYSAIVGNFYHELMKNLDYFIYLDVLFSKAKFAREYKCHKQTISDHINLVGARHPLIDQTKIVKNTIDFSDHKMILITGPNTGGKTVTLKTLGLLSLMNQFGMLLPTDEHSSIRIFDHIFSDIGDEQSIESSLSTFSAHMTNIIRIFNNLNNRSLVLLDELCSGTDPKEGASLARAILERILDYDAICMATTHYPELKSYAYSNPLIVNASTEFDVESLKPTYKLSIGIPGRSNAFDISYRLGLPDLIVSKARENMETNDIEISNLINSLEDTRKYYEDKLEELNNREQALLDKEVILETKSKELEDKVYNDKERAKEEATKIVKEAREKADEIIKELMDYKGNKLHELNEYKKKLEDVQDSYKKEVKENHDNYNYKVGDRVKVLSYNQSGTINKVLPNGNYMVSMGILKTEINKKNLELIKNEEKKITSGVSFKKTKHVSLELDLRGMRYQEAIDALDKYIDDLIVANIKQANIIHGVGTNALRKGCWEYLSKCKAVKEYSIAPAHEGGAGNTIIKLK